MQTNRIDIKSPNYLLNNYTVFKYCRKPLEYTYRFFDCFNKTLNNRAVYPRKFLYETKVIRHKLKYFTVTTSCGKVFISCERITVVVTIYIRISEWSIKTMFGGGCVSAARKSGIYPQTLADRHLNSPHTLVQLIVSVLLRVW